MSADNKAIVIRALTGVFVDKDAGVVDEIFSPDYKQHNPAIPNGREAIKAVIGSLGPDFKYEIGMVAAEGEYVMVHGRYTGWAPNPMIAVDVFRVVDGKLAEHWDVMQEEVVAAATASGNAMFTNPQALS
ncbi:nuclear transport factor 2 family protein [Sphingobium amiense]|uniref:nuclear transport factor 2 family protein n=1 Tax=Sphingobium amiense TaxID=135719 RepID=UPI0018D54F4E|nr:nuclear transport factor 2 family protein [Sphingobium amiense]